MSQPYYNSDLMGEEWQQIASLLPLEKSVSKEQAVDTRRVERVFYRAGNGIKGRTVLSNFTRV